VSPVGSDAQSTFRALIEGRSGIDRVSFELDERFEVRIAGEAAPFDAGAVLGPKEAGRQARFTQLAAVAAAEAIADAGLRDSRYPADRIATYIGVGLGGIERFVEGVLQLDRNGPMRISPYALPALIPNMAAGVVAILAGAQGPCYCPSSACASSAHAIGEAVELLRRGGADAVIAGGGEAGVTPLAIASFNRIHALSRRNDEPQRASRPFDKDRDGFVIAEGAAITILETLSSARKRGAKIYAEVAGYGASADAFHITQPDAEGRGAWQSMTWALRDAGIGPEEVGYINAHGTSTPYNDITETRAIKRAFGDHAKRLWVSSTKSMTGHLLGAAGSLELIATALAMQRGLFPPTINLDQPDPACDLDYVPNHTREGRHGVALSNSFGFGGQNASLVLRTVV
jgi:3-oxoacyl-[acyl-carrier-protein] synthase II